MSPSERPDPADPSTPDSTGSPTPNSARATPPLSASATFPAGPTHLVLAARTLRVAALRFTRDHGFDRAASLAYTSLLAIVPAALLAVSVVELLDAAQRLAVADRILEMVFPPEAVRIREGFHAFLDQSRQVFLEERGGAGLRIFSFLVLVYFAGKLLQSVDRMVAEIWGGGGFRQFLRRLSAYWAVVTVGPILLGLSFTATAVAGDILGPAAGDVLARVLPFLVTWLAVFLFYRLMPHTHVRWTAALAGAVVAGTAWEASKLGLGWYLSRPKTFMTTLSFFPAALLWMYVSWVIAVYGLEVAYVVQHRSWRSGARALPGPRAGIARDALALASMVEIAVAFDEGRPIDRTSLAANLGAAEDETADVVELLAVSGLVDDDKGSLRPARGAAGIRAVDVIEATRGAQGTPGGGAPSRASAAFLERLARDGAAACGDVTVADLAAGHAAPAGRPDAP